MAAKATCGGLIGLKSRAGVDGVMHGSGERGAGFSAFAS